jgi:hypothetical protein
VTEISSNPRAFNIETIALGSRALTCVSIESEEGRINDPVVYPPDWADRVALHIDDAETVFVTYFPNEIAQNIFPIPVLGRIASMQAGMNLSVYRDVVDMAAERGKRIACADMANSVGYLAREFTVPNWFFIAFAKGPANPELTWLEQRIPTPTDARRVFTTRAIRQESESLPEGSKLLYVAAPAHVRRVKQYALGEPTERDERRLRRYLRKYRALDTRTRFYDFVEGEWALTGTREIE